MKADELALWARAKVVFLEALEREESERSDFVVEACGGDVRLQEEVESLLLSEKAASSLLEIPAVRLLSDDAGAESEVSCPRLQPGARGAGPGTG